MAAPESSYKWSSFGEQVNVSAAFSMEAIKSTTALLLPR